MAAAYEDSRALATGPSVPGLNSTNPPGTVIQGNCMKTRLLSLAALASTIVYGQNQPVLGEETVKISDHVWAIMGWPNIGIVVGSRAVLVVDTGLGPRNGATISRVVSKLAPGDKKLFLTRTPF